MLLLNVTPEVKLLAMMSPVNDVLGVKVVQRIKK